MESGAGKSRETGGRQRADSRGTPGLEAAAGAEPPAETLPRWARAAILVAGIVLGQAILYGPSLVGNAVLLPVDLLAQPRWYLPRTEETAEIVPHNIVLSDPILAIEIHRRFARQELRAGRLPLWDPYNYTGTPMVRWAPFSPFNLLYTLLPVPVGLAWIQLLKALLAGIGAYVFFRRVPGARFAAAAVGGIAYPITGFYTLWQSFPLSDVTAWLPWVLWATDRAVRRPGGWGGPALALATAAVLWSGKVDIAGQVLLASGVYALGCLLVEHGLRPGLRTAVRALGAPTAGWTLGILLAMPYVLPLGEYLKTGLRVAERLGGTEERPPVGLAALPQVVMPDLYGSWIEGSYRIVPGNRLSSSASAYVGLVATLLLAPLGLASRRHRGLNRVWLALAVLGLGWTLNLPGIVQLLRLPGLNLMSHNRFVFVTAFAVLALAVTGLDRLSRGAVEWRRWFWAPVVLTALLGMWSLFLSTHLPEPVATVLARHLEQGRPVLRVPDAAALARVQATFAHNYRKDALLCGLALAGWLGVVRSRRRRAFPPGWAVPLLGVLAVGELLAFGYGLAPQSDPRLDYPDIPILSRLAAAPPGRVLCLDCLPPGLNERFRLREVRGYDGVDPARLVELLRAVGDPTAEAASYAPVMWYRPRATYIHGTDTRIPPALDLLGVRYLILRGAPPEGVTPWGIGDDYWVVENPRALPRVFIPRRVERVESAARRLERLAAEDFDPRGVAYLEAELPEDLPQESRGTAAVTAETPTRITIDLEMETPGLVVLTDLGYPGWRARIDGEPVPVLQADHALRGVVAPAGASELVFSYEPGSLAWGLRLLLVGLGGLLIWVVGKRPGRRIG
jgi:hypothetical protein